MNLRTDLAVESIYTHHGEGIKENTLETQSGIIITTVKIISEEASNKVGKPIGTYVTLENKNGEARDVKETENLSEALADELKKLLPKNAEKILVCGLGNRSITPDALGPMCTDGLMITNHIINHLNASGEKDFSAVSAIAPGVMGITGIETGDIIKGIADFHKPDAVIAVDALCAANAKRMFTTVQITDSGINPGAGIGNRREGLNEKTLGVPVIAVGVPTVVDADSIIYDAVHSFFEKNNSLSDGEKIINAMLSETKSLIVSPKDIDRLIKKSSKIIANGINLALHKNIDFEFMENYIS